MSTPHTASPETAHLSRQPKRTIVSIQVLRAVAAYLVIFVHIGILFKDYGIKNYFLIGSCGVDIFFVISGFIMVYATDAKPEMSAKEFLRHRFARIIPSYWLLTCAVFLLGRVGRIHFSGTQVTVENLIKSFLFVPYVRPDGRMEPLLYVGWSLNYEMVFYLAFALAMAGRGRMSNLRWLVAAMVALVASRLLPFDLPRELHFYRSPVLLDFVYGMAFARYHSKFPTDRLWSRVATAVLVLGFCTMLAWQAVMNGMVSSIGGGLLAALVVASALQIEACGRWPKWPFGESMGNASYALYLTHPFVVSAVVMIVHYIGIKSPQYPAIASVAILGISTILAIGYYVHVERGLLKRGMAGRGLLNKLAFR